jgi:energy-coupling factor transporter ATP-binding protein EcfA2
LLDEPEGGLDQESVAMLKGLLEEWTQTGGTVLMTTHNVELGLAWAHRAAVLCDGKVHFQEDPNHNGAAEIQRLLTRPSRAGLSWPVGTQL